MYELYVVDALGQRHFVGKYSTINTCRNKEADTQAAGYLRLRADQGNPIERTVPYHAIVRFEIVKK